MADMTRRLFLRHLRGTPTTWVRHHVARQGPARGDRPVVLVPAAHRRAVRGAGRRPRAAAALPRPYQRLRRRHRAGHGDVPGGRPGAGGGPAGLLDRPDRGRAAGPAAGPGRHPAGRTRPAARPRPARPAPAGRGADHRDRPGPRGGLRRAARRPRLTETGVGVVSARVVAIRPEPELERALQTPTREAVQQAADRATYDRRAQAVEQERAIAENELQNKIELARREQQLVEQHGANEHRRAELEAAARLVAAQGEAQRRRWRPPPPPSGPGWSPPRRRTRSGSSPPPRPTRSGRWPKPAPRAYARSASPRPRPRPPSSPRTGTLPADVLRALALKELAGKLPEIGQLTVTPDVVTDLLAPGWPRPDECHPRPPGGRGEPSQRARRAAGPPRHPGGGRLLPAPARPRPRRGARPGTRRCRRR